MDVASLCLAHARPKMQDPQNVDNVAQSVEHYDKNATKVGITLRQGSLYQFVKY